VIKPSYKDHLEDLGVKKGKFVPVHAVMSYRGVGGTTQDLPFSGFVKFNVDDSRLHSFYGEKAF